MSGYKNDRLRYRVACPINKFHYQLFLHRKQLPREREREKERERKREREKYIYI